MRILKIESLYSKKDGWLDRDELLLHSSFQILKDFVEKELIEEYTCQEENEIRFLYNWWLERAKKEIDNTDSQYEEDNQMLIRLIKIRRSLWT